MQADILAGGLNTEVEAAGENMEGVATKSNIKKASFDRPSWLKSE